MRRSWDAGSAALIALAGAQAIATTSGGITWSLGRCDGQRLTRAEMIQRIREIVAAVTIPVTADIEAGYGSGPEDVALTAEAVIAAGAFVPGLTDRQVITKLAEASPLPLAASGGACLLAAITPPRWLRLPARPRSQPGCRR